MPFKFTKATDKPHQEKLESSIISALWKKGAAYGGRKAEFEILTAFVGNGAPIKITGKSEKGKKLGKIQDQIMNNKFVGEFDIPDDIKLDDFVYFEVDLSKNGLKDESNHIPARPPITVTNMKWSAPQAREGDVLTLSADIGEVKDGTEGKLTIHEFDRDGIHDKIVEIPVIVQNKKIELQWKYEYHEDTDEIPTDDEMQKYGKNYNPPEYFFTIKIDEEEFGKKQESGILTFKDWISITLVGAGDKSVSGQDYEVTLPDGTVRKGKLDSKGYAIEKDIPPGKVIINFPNLI